MQQPGGIVTRFLTALRGQADDLDPGYGGGYSAASNPTPLAGMGEALVEQLPDPVLVVTAEGKILKANNAARTLFGPESQGRMLPVAIRVPAVHDAVAELAAGRAPGPVDFTLPGPLERHLTLRSAMIEGEGNTAGPLILLLFHDTTAIKRAEQMRVDFVANASHELRSPLARLKMALALRPDRERDPKLDQEVQRNLGELDALLEELLMSARVEAQQGQALRREPVDLLGLVAEEAARVDVPLDELEGELPDDWMGDERLVRRAIRNLLENARRYGGDSQSVALRRSPGTIDVVVLDRGPGVPEALRERIFEPFFRLPGHAEVAGGVGLGLALVRQIAEAHGGAVRCEPREGGGSRFVLSLPT